MSDSENDEDLKKAIALSLGQPWPPKRVAEEVTNLVSDDEDDDLDAPVVARQIASQNKPQERVVIDLESSLELGRNDSGHGKRKAGAKNKLSQPPKTSAVASTGNESKGNEGGSNIYTMGGSLETSRARDSKKDNITVLPAIKSEPSDISESKGKMSSSAIGTMVYNNAESTKDSTPPTQGILGLLNRKQMEEERLARASRMGIQNGKETVISINTKRKASTSPQRLAGRDGRQTIAKPSRSLPETQSSGKASPEIFSHKTHQGASGVQYPNGVVKKTWAFGYPRTNEDIKIEEVLQKDDLELAVLSSFQVDHAWVASKLDPETKVIWVLQAKDQATKDFYRSTADKNYKFCFPSMEGQVNCMHSKLQLLAHQTHLRIVVPTANLVSFDWGETGVMENMVFLIDLPRHPEGKMTAPSEVTSFATELKYFLNAMGLDQKTIDSLGKFDFSRTARLEFVHSIGGSHSGSNFKRTGYCGLGSAVRRLGLQTEEALTVDFVASSIGSLKLQYLKSMYLAFQGDDGMAEYEWRTNKPSKAKGQVESAAERKISDDIKKFFKIYFPTHETVARSRGGIQAGGTICTQPKWFYGDAFPRSLFRDCESLREGMLMHSKMIFTRPHKTLRGSVAWAYVGSANLSESAWGRLVKDRTTKQPKLNCPNWECGIIFPIPTHNGANGLSGQEEGPAGMDVFNNHVPVPLVIPGADYAGRKPWCYNE
ncbi:tyrosyl-DNA phosphodiesterase-domain-containing protein [Tricladium varicosporioides]|nr:tyrosyl-DNA phosphodiesterase-domain-containing protein [Hymenoscyphus varicosporioides]